MTIFDLSILQIIINCTVNYLNMKNLDNKLLDLGDYVIA